MVCEGKKTEPNYLKEMRDSMRIHAANLHVVHEGVTEPRQIVDAAWELFQNGNGSFRRKAADVVVAVFDRDEHRTYHDALDYAASLDAKSPKNDDRQPVRFLAVPSNSCFDPRADGPWTGMHLLVHLLLDEGLVLPKHPAPVVGDPTRISEVAKRLEAATRD